MALIVVATNNGKTFLPGLLESLEQHGTSGHNVLLVDTGSKCPESIAFLEQAKAQSWPFGLDVIQTPYSGYDTGAYIHAFRTVPADDYLFIHDSVLVKTSGWVEAFTSRCTYGVGCVPWLSFPMQWESEAQVHYVSATLHTDKFPPMGIFGPMFYTTRAALEKLDRAGRLDQYPTNKPQQTAMERGWATAFILSGLGVRPVETTFAEELLYNDGYTHLTKRFGYRI